MICNSLLTSSTPFISQINWVTLIFSSGFFTFPVTKIEALSTDIFISGLKAGLNLKILFKIFVCIIPSLILVPIPFSFTAEPTEATPRAPIMGAHD